MADKNEQVEPDTEAAEPKTSIFDLFEPPPERDPNNSFGKIPVIKESEVDLAGGASAAELKAAADAEAAGLQHWTAPPTGQVPAVLTSEKEQSGLWADVKGPSWHGDDPSWAGPDLADVFADTDSINLDASLEDYDDDEDDDEYGESELGAVATRRPTRPGSAPVAGFDDETQVPPPPQPPPPRREDRPPQPPPVEARPERPAQPQPQARVAPRRQPPPPAPAAADQRTPDQPNGAQVPPRRSIFDEPNPPPPASEVVRPGPDEALPVEPVTEQRRAVPPPPPLPGDGHPERGPVGTGQHRALAPNLDPRAPGRPDPAPDEQGTGRQALDHPPAPPERTVSPAPPTGLLGPDVGVDPAGSEPNIDDIEFVDSDHDEHDEYEEYDDYEYDEDEADQAIGLSPVGGRNIPKAIGVGLALAGVVLAAMWLGPYPTLLIVVVLALLAVLELYNAMRLAGLRPATLLGIVGTVAAPAAAYYRGDAAFPLIVALAVVFGTLWYLVGADTERPVLNLSLTLLGVFWVGGLAAFAALMLRLDGGIQLLLATIIITVVSDTMAYIGGRAYGSRPFHHASPNKTWEGTITGFAGAVFAGFAIGVTDMGTIWEGNLVPAIVLGAVVGCLAPMGDLAESVVKRDLGVKDMGTLLPGHGGVLDRMDALLFALPGAYYVALIYGII